MEISKIYAQSSHFNSHLTFEKWTQRAVKPKDTIDSFKESEGRSCCSSIRNFFHKLWTTIINVFRSLFCYKFSSDLLIETEDLEEPDEELTQDSIDRQLRQLIQKLDQKIKGKSNEHLRQQK